MLTDEEKEEVGKKEEVEDLLRGFFAREKWREADEANYLAFVEPLKEAEQSGTPSCISTDRIRSAWISKNDWTSEEEEHIKTCRYCRFFVPFYEGVLADRAKSNSFAKTTGSKQPTAINTLVHRLLGKIGDLTRHVAVAPKTLASVSACAVCFLLFGAYWRYSRFQPRQFPTSSLFAENFVEQYSGSGLGSTLRGLGSQAERPFNLTPVATAIRSLRPHLQWRGASGQTNYQVHLWKNALSPQESEMKNSPFFAKATFWQPAQDLAPGNYRWNVNIVGRPATTPGTIFVILSPSETIEINKAEASNINDDVALSSLYMKHRLYMDAYAPLDRLYRKSKDQRIQPMLQIAERALGKTRTSIQK